VIAAPKSSGDARTKGDRDGEGQEEDEGDAHLAAKKQVKGGLRRTGDPCDGGEVAGKRV
jgi:hypothetical protein